MVKPLTVCCKCRLQLLTSTARCRGRICCVCTACPGEALRALALQRQLLQAQQRQPCIP